MDVAHRLAVGKPDVYLRGGRGDGRAGTGRHRRDVVAEAEGDRDGFLLRRVGLDSDAGGGC